MVQIMYTITRANELIFAQNFQHDTKKDAQEALKATQKDIIAVQEKNGIKDIIFTGNTLMFTQALENEIPEIHTIMIQKGVK